MATIVTGEVAASVGQVPWFTALGAQKQPTSRSMPPHYSGTRLIPELIFSWSEARSKLLSRLPITFR